MKKLKEDLFDTLVYIVEDTIKTKDIKKIINKDFVPAIKRYMRRAKK